MAPDTLRPIITRRNALGGIATAAVATAFHSGALASATATQDPLYEAIANYRLGDERFNLINENDWGKMGGQDQVIQNTYREPLEVLQNWTKPANSREGAMEALQLAVEEASLYQDSNIAGNMIQAALDFFKTQV